MYNENINIDKILNEMQVKSFKNDSLMEGYLSKQIAKIGIFSFQTASSPEKISPPK